MRSSKSRSRNKSNRQRTLGNVVNRVFDSSGPEGKVRGTPQQIIDKYLTLARDAQLSNDRVAEQSFLQHAEHYTRMLGEALREQAERQAQHQQQNPHHQNQRQSGEDERGGEGGDRGGHENGHQPRQGNARRGDGQDNDAAATPTEGEQDRDQPREQKRQKATGRRNQRDDNQPSAGLPDAVAGDAEEAEASNLVETPESQPKPKRSRAPKGEASPRPATRSRRKPANAAAATGEEPAEPAADSAGESAEQG